MTDLLLSLAFQGICCYAKGTAAVRLGCAGREEYSDMYVASSKRRTCADELFADCPGNYLIVSVSKSADDNLFIEA
jgi:hypothetical protein